MIASAASVPPQTGTSNHRYSRHHSRQPPTALIAGFPLESGSVRLALAGVGAVVLWMVVGGWAARRSARSPVAGWREWWREYLWLLVPVWGGTLAALAIMRYLAL